MKNNFDWTFQDAFEKTNPLFNWSREDRPAEFEKNTLLNNGKEILITSSGFVAENNTATFRYSRIQSAVLDIATVMIYPTVNSLKMPVFACEWVLVQDKIHVIVLDIEWLQQSDEAPLLYQQLKADYEKWVAVFPPKKEWPAWFSEIASEVALFSEAAVSQMPLLQKSFNAYLNKWTAYCTLHTQEFLQGKDNEKVKEYKHHHYLNSPARTIIKGDNEAWLNTFLKDYHFA